MHRKTFATASHFFLSHWNLTEIRMLLRCCLKDKQKENHIIKYQMTTTLLDGTIHPSVIWMCCYLFMRVNVDVALDAFLPHVGPGVPAHPLPLALRAFVFPEAPLLSLVRGQAFTFGSSLNTESEQEINSTPSTHFQLTSLLEMPRIQMCGPQQLCKQFGFRLSSPLINGFSGRQRLSCHRGSTWGIHRAESAGKLNSTFVSLMLKNKKMLKSNMIVSGCVLETPSSNSGRGAIWPDLLRPASGETPAAVCSPLPAPCTSAMNSSACRFLVSGCVEPHRWVPLWHSTMPPGPPTHSQRPTCCFSASFYSEIHNTQT